MHILHVRRTTRGAGLNLATLDEAKLVIASCFTVRPVEDLQDTRIDPGLRTVFRAMSNHHWRERPVFTARYRNCTIWARRVTKGIGSGRHRFWVDVVGRTEGSILWRVVRSLEKEHQEVLRLIQVKITSTQPPAHWDYNALAQRLARAGLRVSLTSLVAMIDQASREGLGCVLWTAERFQVTLGVECSGASDLILMVTARHNLPSGWAADDLPAVTDLRLAQAMRDVAIRLETAFLS